MSLDRDDLPEQVRRMLDDLPEELQAEALKALDGIPAADLAGIAGMAVLGPEKAPAAALALLGATLDTVGPGALQMAVLDVAAKLALRGQRDAAGRLLSNLAEACIVGLALIQPEAADELADGPQDVAAALAEHLARKHEAHGEHFVAARDSFREACHQADLETMEAQVLADLDDLQTVDRP